ncbi:hypothetical protein, partial [Hyphococcus sp.]
MPSKKAKPPVIILDVANIGSAKNLLSVFPKCIEHLRKGKVKAVRGGKKFNKELKGVTSLLSLFVELSRANAIEKLDDSDIDDEQRRFEALIVGEFGRKRPECDDPHLFALAKLANSRSVVSRDKRIALCSKCLKASNIANSEF